jgi:hypothetical protein
MEGVEVVDPSHRQDVAPGLTGRAGRNEGGVGCQADRGFPVPSTKPVSSRPSWYVKAGCSAASTATSEMAAVAARA